MPSAGAPPWSLRRRLLAAILAASTVLWLGSLGTVTVIAWQETGEVFDDALEESAYMLMAATTDLDARGLNCPLPILKAKKALAEMMSGEVLRVVATDSGSVRDFQAFAKQTGNQLLEHSESGQEFTFYMRRK